MSLALHALALGYGLLAGGAIPLGGLLSWREHIQPRWLERELRHGIIAFGGGALVAAVALVLIPEGIARISALAAVVSFAAGGVCFLVIDRDLALRGEGRPQLMAMLLDFIPEAIALGASLTAEAAFAPLLAWLIAIQNLPESFNAFRELRSQGRKPRRVLLTFCLVALLGPAAAWLGLTFLSGRPEVLGALMLFASGGILYLIFQDIAPQARLERAWGPSLGAIAGFLLGLVGYLMVRSQTGS